MGSERQDRRDSVTGSEVATRELFDFGPDVERPETGPVASLPPWMAEPFAGQTLSARLAALSPAAVATDVAVDATEMAEDVTPEPVAVPEFARIVPAPRKRRKPVPADHVVIAAPAVVDGFGNVVPTDLDADIDLDTDIDGRSMVPALAPAPLVPAQRAEGSAETATDTIAADTDGSAPPRRRRRWVGRTQAAAIVAIGASVGIYAAGGLGFLENRTKADPPTAEASAWVLNNLAGAGSVLVPASLTDTLLSNGQDSDALTTYPEGSTAPLDLGKNCCSYLVILGGPGEEPGAGLPESVRTLFDRSRPAAVFTTGGGWTQIRQVLPGSPAKVAADLAADRKALVATGRSLIASGRVGLSDAAKAQLQNGEVDARVLLGIVAIALEHKVTIAGFPALPGEADAGILRRSAAISEIDGKAVQDGSGRVTSVKGVLAAQTGVFRPVGAEVHAVDGATALEFRFDAPSPFGLLTLTDEDGKR